MYSRLSLPRRRRSFGVVVALFGSVCHAQIAGSYDLSGTGCPGSSLAYEQFAPGMFDLGGASLEWFPNAGHGYIVASGGSPMLPIAGGTNITLGDDEVSAPLNLGFTFSYPTGLGSTTQAEVSSNGYVYLEVLSIASSRCCEGTGRVFDAFRADTPSWAVYGLDLDPSSGGSMWFNTLPGVAYFTWDAVPELGVGQPPNTCQLQLYNDGRAVMVWGTIGPNVRTALVGWSGGGGVEDGGPTDFSAAVPFDMGASSGPLTVSAPLARLPTTGLSFQIDLDNVPADAVNGVLLLGAFPLNVDLDVLGMINCDFLTAADIGAVALTLTPPTGLVTLPIPTTPGTAGLSLSTQAAVIAPSVNTFGLSTSNRGTLNIGDFSPVIVRARGADNFNDDETQGFWAVINASPIDIVALRLSWTGSSVPNTNYFDTNQTGMRDRFDGGNSTTPNCAHTYRNGSDAAVGLDYANSSIAACAAGATRAGWVGSHIGISPGDFRTLTFAFTSFNQGDIFEFDVDTDGGPGNGGAMAGLVVTITLAGGAVVTGELTMIDANTSQVNL